MKKYVIICVILLAKLNVHAQIPYETLQSWSSFINKIQTGTEGKTFSDGTSMYKLSFSDTNFNIMYHNGLAYQAVYMEKAGREWLRVEEGIDFSKAISVLRLGTDGQDAGAVRVLFPEQSISSVFYENGKKTAPVKSNQVDFFFSAAAGKPTIWSAESNPLFDTLAEIIYRKKIAAGKLTESQYRDAKTAWKKALTTFTEESMAAFAQSYGSSLYGEQAKQLRDVKGEKNRVTKLINEKMDSLALGYKFKWRMSESEFFTFNPEGAKLITGKNDKYNTGNYTRKYNGIGKPWPEGPQSVTSKNGIIIYSYVIKSGKGETAENTAFFVQLKTTLRLLFEDAVITEKTDSINIASPDKSRAISLNIFGFNKHSAVMITFM